MFTNFLTGSTGEQAWAEVRADIAARRAAANKTNTQAKADLDSFIGYLSDNKTSTTKNYFDSDEFKSFKGLSLELADKAETRDLRLMNEARNKRNQEYQRNYNEASNLYNAGQSHGYGSGSMGSRRYDGMD